MMALSKRTEISEETNKGEEEDGYLPNEMWSLIMRRLCFEDQIHLRSSCRSWLRAGMGTSKPRLQFPWFIIYKDDLSSYFLYNPTTAKSHLFQPSFPPTCCPHPKHRALLLASSSGLLLMAFLCRPEAPFLYNPFTRCSLRIPAHTAIPSYMAWCCPKYAFHYCPVDRLVTVYAAWLEPGIAVVTSWRTRDKAWNILARVNVIHDNYNGRELAKLSLTCDKRVLYCYFSREKLVVFRHTTNNLFDRIDVQLPLEFLPEYVFFDTISLCISEGDLYVVSKYGFTNHTCTRHVVKLDLAKRTWDFEVDTEKAYFYGGDNLSAVVISEPIKRFTGRFISAINGSCGFEHCVFSNVSISHIAKYVSTTADDRWWWFHWPQNVLSHYARDQLQQLNVLCIETPTL